MRNEETPIEIVRPWKNVHIRYALFDFDGTVSLIREGWQNIMISYFTEVLLETGSGETAEELRNYVRKFVTELTGKQTIFQCLRLNEEVVCRRGPERDPFDYKKEYLRRLEKRIRGRKEILGQDKSRSEEYMVPGARNFIMSLRRHRIKCYLASGTDESDVVREAGLLGIDGLFDGGIHGAHDEVTACSKELVIRDMIEREKIQPNELVSFGDGFVEMELTANLGGLAVGVASNEKSRVGINAWKRRRLIEAGANAIIPNFIEEKKIYEFIRREPNAIPKI